jgi:hypothetical protein
MPEFLTDGSLSFAGGVNSIKPTTVASQSNPDGLPRNALAWMNNASVRDSGISPRDAWLFKGIFHNPNGLFQGGIIYEPIDGISPPYLLIAISGHIFQVFPDSPATALDLSVKFNLFHPATLDFFYFVQGEQFVVIQAGDLITLPLFWDGALLRRSVGIIAIPNQPSAFTLLDNGYFIIPSVGNTFTMNLDAVYGGNVGDVGDLIIPGRPGGLGGSSSGGVFTPTSGTAPFNAGQFTVTAKTAVAPFSITLRVNKTTIPGTKLIPNTYTFNIISTAPNPSEIPAAGPMDYHHARFWYGQGLKVNGGDIVGGPSGTAAYNNRDSILKVTENPLAIGGDGFEVPTSSGNIRAIKHTAQIDASLGQGDLLISTRKAIYKLDVPISRTDWIAADSTNAPRMTPVQINNGVVGDRCMVNVSGDMYYMSLTPDIQSLIFATRFFGQPGNHAISTNEQRALQFYDRNLLRFTSGIDFSNRLLMTGLPTQTAQGVVHKLITPLDFVPQNTLGETAQPVWNGVYEGIDFMQLFVTGFNGLERGFAVVRLQDGSFSIWEITVNGQFDVNQTGEARIQWSMEFPAFTWEEEFKLKRLEAGELWVDRMVGTVIFEMDYRPDGYTCWIPWHKWQMCYARSTAEDCVNPVDYPKIDYGPGFEQPIGLPKPPVTCITTNARKGRPSNLGFQFQCRLTVKGYCRVRGLILYATPVERALYSAMVPC